MHILIAPNAFKNSLSATEAAHAIQNGLSQSRLEHTATCFPIGDGGNGTGKLICEHSFGMVCHTAVKSPLSKTISAAYYLIENGQTAVIEMAEASGLHLIPNKERNALTASSFGTGQQMLDALNKGVRKIILAVGGSATTDGGTGILSALGIRFFDAATNELAVPHALDRLAFIDMAGLDHRMRQCELIVLCDVDNTLLGDQGAAAVFGPQKGASADDVLQLEQRLSLFADITLEQMHFDIFSVPGGGAAGGTAAGLLGYLQARLVKGSDYFLSLTKFEQALANSSMVITGEGSIDEQTLQGKGPAAVAAMAKKKNLPVIGMGGKIPDQKSVEMTRLFDELISISDEHIPLKESIARTKENLIRKSMELGNRLAAAEK